MRESLINGDPIEFKSFYSAWFACCDCGSTHLFIFMKDEDDKPTLLMFADANETIGVRNAKTVEELDFIIKKLQRFKRKKKKEKKNGIT